MPTNSTPHKNYPHPSTLYTQNMATNSLTSGQIVVCHKCGRAYLSNEYVYCPACASGPQAGTDKWDHEFAMIWLSHFAPRKPEVEELKYKFDSMTLRHVTEAEYHGRVAKALLDFLGR
jgi:hypothetical protein